MTHERLSILNYDPSANGTFSAWDQFGQVTDQKWTNNGSTADRYQYAYDYDGNRSYRQNSGPSASSLDEAYSYDGLGRVKDLQRGTLSGSTITGTPAREEVFTLDELGNWPEYLTKASGTTDLDQTRAHNAANETGTITHVTGTTWVSPSYDSAGNMTAGIKPGSEDTGHKGKWFNSSPFLCLAEPWWRAGVRQSRFGRCGLLADIIAEGAAIAKCGV